MASPRRDTPQFPIAPILEELGAVDVPRVRGGGYARLACPFHQDSTPSASVSQYGFTCWGCDRSGDAIKLIREEEGGSFADAVARCQEITGITSDSIPPASGGRPSLLDI